MARLYDWRQAEIDEAARIRAMETTITLDAKRLAQGVTMHVKFDQLREWVWRARIANLLLRLVALIMWCKLDVELEITGNGDPVEIT